MSSWDRPTAVVVAQNDHQAQLGLAALERADFRCRNVETFDTGILALTGAPFDLLVVQAIDADPDALWHFLQRLRDYADATPLRVVAATTLTEVDILAEGLFDIRSEILCDPDDDEVAHAVLRVAEAPARRLRDSGGAQTARSSQPRDDIDRLTAALSPSSRHGSTEPAEGGVSADMVRRAIWERRLRDRFFDPDLFADPAWDILLDLFLGDLERRPTCVSSLCIAAATPPTTALRWIRTMTGAGLLERSPDPEDGRRHFLNLSESACTAMTSYFATVADRAT